MSSAGEAADPKRIAAWVALEYILVEGVRFYVYPGTHMYVPGGTCSQSSSGWDLVEYHSSFVFEMEELIRSGAYQVYAPPLEKGGYFFSRSRIIHGSAAGKNRPLLRKSIAAHLIPEGYAYGNLDTDFEISYEQKYGLKYAIDQMDENLALKNSSPASSIPLSSSAANQRIVA